MDLKIDPGLPRTHLETTASLRSRSRNTDNYNYVQQFGDNVRSADGWRHISASPLVPPDDAIRAITWQLYGGPSQNINGTLTMWIDNVEFTTVPEPSTFALAGLVGFALITLRLLHKRHNSWTRFVRVER